MYDSSTYANSSAELNPVVLVLYAVIAVVMIAAVWKVFTKAGKPGWGALVPFYNTYLLLKICGRPGWWLLLLFVPLVNYVILIILSLDLAKVFGKSALFGIIALLIFSPIGYAMLGFGGAKYVGVDGGPTPPAGPTPGAPASAAPTQPAPVQPEPPQSTPPAV